MTLKDLLKKRKLSQSEVVRRTDINITRLNQFVNGVRDLSDRDKMTLSGFFGVPIAKLEKMYLEARAS